MNGPEHYRAAEQNMTYAADVDTSPEGERYHLAMAQVHATLALAAATVEQAAHSTDWHAAVTS